jgi:hypothetical protein
MRYAVVAALFVLVHAPIVAGSSKRSSDADVRKRMIAESIEGYPGPCACPYQRASNGSQCGRRSAYNRGGGYEPLCFPSDISDEMVKGYRAQNGLD